MPAAARSAAETKKPPPDDEKSAPALNDPNPCPTLESESCRPSAAPVRLPADVTVPKESIACNSAAAAAMTATRANIANAPRASGVSATAAATAPNAPLAAAKRLSADQVRLTELGGEPVQLVLTPAPGNCAPIDGVKVEASSAWFASRPYGTEDVYKIYAESFRGADHLRLVLEEAQTTVDGVLPKVP